MSAADQWRRYASLLGEEATRATLAGQTPASKALSSARSAALQVAAECEEERSAARRAMDRLLPGRSLP